MSDRTFENVMFFSLSFLIVGSLLTLYSYFSSPTPMSEPIQTNIEKRVKVAIIDTGLELSPEIRPFLCKEGHFSTVDESPFFENNEFKHGTNVAGLIARNLDPEKECLLIIKFYHKYSSQVEFAQHSRKAIEYAYKRGAKFINISYGGDEPMLSEYRTLQAALKAGVKISVAAGNQSKNLDGKCTYFPACYEMNSDNFHVVGSSTGNYSNTGEVVRFLEDGTDQGTPLLTGTSQATAIHTGKWVRYSSK